MHSCIIYSHWLIEFSILAPKITEFFSLNLQSINFPYLKQVTVHISDKKHSLFIELVKNLSFVKKVEMNNEPDKKQILKGISEAVKEMKKIKSGKKKAAALNDFLDEL